MYLKILIKHNLRMKARTAVFIVCLIVLSIFQPMVAAWKLLENDAKTEDFNPVKNWRHGWHQITQDGFGTNTNLASRGLAVYQGELYIGTQNVHLPKIIEQCFPKLFDFISKFFPTEIMNYIQRTTIFRILLRYMHHLRTSTMNTIVHAVVRSSDGCEIWRYNYSTDSLVQIVGARSIVGMDAGFGSFCNSVATTMCVFDGYLYVGTWNTPLGNINNPFRWGGEIWRFDGNSWEQVVGHKAPKMKGGFGNRNNVGIWSMYEFKEHLYVGTMNWDFSSEGGCEIWRTKDGLMWDQVVNNGFRSNMSYLDRASGVTNIYAWSMQEFNDTLYVGTFNECYRWLASLGMGCQIWCSDDGIAWEKVTLDDGIFGKYRNGLGHNDNYGIRTMVVFDDELYVGTAANIIENSGCEIWKYNGAEWSPVVSSRVPGINPGDKCSSGFGNPLNKYVWSMAVTSDDRLWVGTANGKFINLFKPLTEGCELWCFDGITWEQVVGSQAGDPSSGFGNINNEGARSMIEYPVGSGNIVVGTFKLVSTRMVVPPEGFELWMWVN